MKIESEGINRGILVKNEQKLKNNSLDILKD